MSTDEPASVLRQVLAALQQGDWSIFDIHPGLYETRGYFPRLLAAFPDLHFTITREVVQRDMISCVIMMDGTHLGSFRGIAPTGLSVSFLLLMTDQVVDGKIVQHWALPDFMSLFQQLGVADPFSDLRPGPQS